MHKYETALELIARFLRDFFRAKDEMVRKQAAATNAELRIAFPCQDTVDEFDSGPYAAGILPATARAAQPFAQDSACCHEAAVLLFQAPGEGVNLVGGTHAHGNERGEKTGGDGQARSSRDVIHFAYDLDAAPRSAGEA